MWFSISENFFLDKFISALKSIVPVKKISFMSDTQNSRNWNSQGYEVTKVSYLIGCRINFFKLHARHLVSIIWISHRRRWSWLNFREQNIFSHGKILIFSNFRSVTEFQLFELSFLGVLSRWKLEKNFPRQIFYLIGNSVGIKMFMFEELCCFIYLL